MINFTMEMPILYGNCSVGHSQDWTVLNANQRIVTSNPCRYRQIFGVFCFYLVCLFADIGKNLMFLQRFFVDFWPISANNDSSNIN